tara:strand:+ start:22366 stop:22797 length:432 start_codon:yes stop_codon:yes gene_type:complete
MPKLLKGGIFSDHRGQLTFMNEFDAAPVKRFYLINHPDKKVVRAWHAHKVESRWFYCTKGRFDFRTLPLSAVENTDTADHVETFVLDAQEPQLLEIPPGHAHGFRALEENSELLVFADFLLGENPDDHYRFESKNWTDWGSEA